jgi:lipopolysaccharide/colanic/teichoic acid biosynthesis glycosyltransferase
MAAWPGSIGLLNNMDHLFEDRRPRFFDACKTVMDYVLALVLLVMVLPILVVCGIIIKVSSRGPVFLRQIRLGKDGKSFVLFKLRTMRLDAEAKSGPVLAAENDNRVLPACKWMRRSHLDELPQLVNVLQGDMSLVGPRPERPEIAEQVYRRLPEFRYRLKVRPGITGLAQVRNGYDTCLDAFKHKLQYDLEYIRRRGWVQEFGILLTTLVKLYDPSAR